MPDYLSSYPLSYFADVIYWVMFIDLSTAFFNLLPIPPLDGSKLLMLFLPRKYSAQIETMGIQGLLIAIIFLYAFGHYISVLSDGIAGLLIGF